MTARIVAAGLTLLVPALLQAQMPDTAAHAAVEAAEQAAAEERHIEAIELYEQAIAADPALEPALRPPLALQYLWSDQPAHAAALLERHLAAEPGDCGMRQHYALALSWADRLREAAAEYREVQALCPELRIEAMMGEARVLLWRNRVRRAEAVYAGVMAMGTPEERVQARIGLANAALATFEPRRARRLFRELYAEGVREPGVLEGLAEATQESGLLAEALEVLREAEGAGIRTGTLERVREEIALSRRLALRVAPEGFRDADGTERQALGGIAAIALGAGGSAEVALGRSRLSGREMIEGWHGRAAGAYRQGPALGLAGSLAAHGFAAVDFHPMTGEINLAWTPGDLRRVDLSAARLIVLDNVAALQHGLIGTFAAAGVDEGITRWTAISAGMDVTRWNAGNVRTRARLAPRHRFGGVPMVTAEWPTLYQRYSEPFDFPFFSPPEYWETGPGVDVYYRIERLWHLSGYLRGGAQRETGRAWSPLGMARLSIERELRRAWGVRIDLSWSNSNLAGTTGFERTAARAEIARRF